VFRVHANFARTQLTCKAVGAKTSRFWQYGRQDKSLCKFESGGLAGMYALVAVFPADAISNVWLIVPAFLDADPSFRDIVLNEGGAVGWRDDHGIKGGP